MLHFFFVLIANRDMLALLLVICSLWCDMISLLVELYSTESNGRNLKTSSLLW